MSQVESASIVVIPQGAPTGEAIIEWAAGEAAERVEWVRERIAELCLEIRSTGYWPGRAELAVEVAEKYVLSPSDAGQLIDHTVGELCAESPDDLTAQRRLSYLRLRAIRQLILKSIVDGRREVTWKFEYKSHPTNPNMKIEVREKMKEKVYEGIDMGQVAQLRETELAMEALQGLHDKKTLQQQNTLQLIFQKFEEKKGKDGGAGSMAASAKQLSLEKLIENPEAAAKLKQAVDELSGVPEPVKPKAKKVKSKVRTKTETEDRSG